MGFSIIDISQDGKLNKFSNPRTGRVIGITPHHQAGFMDGPSCKNYWLNHNTKSSANFVIKDDKCWLVLALNRRAWTSSNANNDQTHYTVEVANSSLAPNYSISSKSYNTLVELAVWIFKKTGTVPKYVSKTGTITIHQNFNNTTCPGPALKSKITSGQFEKDIKAKLAGSATPAPSKPATTTTAKYTVVRGDTLSGIGAKLKVKWQDIAKLNDLKSPYTIYVGQKLKVPTATKTTTKAKSTKKDNKTIAKEVIAGKWGNGDARKTKLKNAGYDYNAVQKEVNKLL